MYDEPPDPEPNPCPICDAEEIGLNDDSCPHCRLAMQFASLDSEHATLKRRLASRARMLAHMPLHAVDGDGVSLRHTQAVALVLDLGGLKLPEEFLKHAAAFVTNEYGESGYTGKTDAELVQAFLDAAQGALNATRAVTYTTETLDSLPQTAGDILCWGDDENGVPRVMSNGEARLHQPAKSCQWGVTLRESIEKALDSQALSAQFWLEFYRDYLQPPKELNHNTKVSFVVGTTAYSGYVGQHKSADGRNHWLGFGGDEFHVQLNDGRQFSTDNNWHRGEVPPRLRKLIRPNAVFLKKEAPPAA